MSDCDGVIEIGYMALLYLKFSKKMKGGKYDKRLLE